MKKNTFLQKGNYVWYLDLVFAEAREPILFTCTDEENNLYLCSRYHADGISKEWLLVPSTPQLMIDLLTDRVTIRQAFIQSGPAGYVVEKKPDAESVKQVSLSDLPAEVLPTDGYYMEAEPGEFEEELSVLRKRLIPKDTARRTSAIRAQQTIAL